MHIPKKFRQENIEELLEIVQQFPFATLVTCSDENVEAIHLPMLLKKMDEDIFLTGHIAKTNSIWEKVDSGSEILVIFNGPNCYVSPNHYPTKTEHGKAVPTWNYVVVHARGLVSFIHEPDWIYGHISELTSEHESKSARPWAITDAPKEYIRKMLPAVVGLEIKVASMIGQWKLSQNQPKINQQGVVEGLLSLEDPASQAIAAMVRSQTE